MKYLQNQLKLLTETMFHRKTQKKDRKVKLYVTTSDCKWLKVTTNGYKRLRDKLRMTTTAIGNNFRHKNVSCFLWLHNNERSKYVKKCSKNSCTKRLVKIIEKYLGCRSSRSHMFFKVKSIATHVFLKTMFKVSVFKYFANFKGKHLC